MAYVAGGAAAVVGVAACVGCVHLLHLLRQPLTRSRRPAAQTAAMHLWALPRTALVLWLFHFLSGFLAVTAQEPGSSITYFPNQPSRLFFFEDSSVCPFVATVWGGADIILDCYIPRPDGRECVRVARRGSVMDTCRHNTGE